MQPTQWWWNYPIVYPLQHAGAKKCWKKIWCTNTAITFTGAFATQGINTEVTQLLLCNSKNLKMNTEIAWLPCIMLCLNKEKWVYVTQI